MPVIPPAEARSLGLKLILVGALAVLIWIPAMLIYALVWDRSNRADTVTAEIVERAGGRQSVSGPIIIVPGAVDTGKTDNNGEAIVHAVTVAFTPKTLDIDAVARTSKRALSIYEASVYEADIVMTGAFSALSPPDAEGTLTLRWDQARLAVRFQQAGHLRGVRDAIGLTINDRAIDAAFEPGVEIAIRDDQITRQSAPGVSAPVPATALRDGFSFALTLPLSGGGALFFSPVGEDTSARLTADWPDPGFQGAYLPDARTIDADGFSAEWRVPYLARPIPRSFFADPSLSRLESSAFGAEFVAATSPYKAVNRALKYALMFVGVIFLTFFLFEATMGARAHAAQYILVGAAQVIFYLLVLAFSEHVGFALAFFITAAATVALSGWYAATVFHSKMHGLIATIAFSAAYGLIYLLMKSEDYALLIGSITAFAALCVTMVVTRNLDWYGARKPDNGPATTPGAT